MRIIIESNEKEVMAPSVSRTTELTPIAPIDGGAPAEMLIQAVAEAVPEPTEVAATRAGMNAGPPPEWLIAAIQATTSPDMQLTTANRDAGAAPSDS